MLVITKIIPTITVVVLFFAIRNETFCWTDLFGVILVFSGYFATFVGV